MSGRRFYGVNETYWIHTSVLVDYLDVRAYAYHVAPIIDNALCTPFKVDKVMKRGAFSNLVLSLKNWYDKRVIFWQTIHERVKILRASMSD